MPLVRSGGPPFWPLLAAGSCTAAAQQPELPRRCWTIPGASAVQATGRGQGNARSVRPTMAAALQKKNAPAIESAMKLPTSPGRTRWASACSATPRTPASCAGCSSSSSLGLRARVLPAPFDLLRAFASSCSSVGGPRCPGWRPDTSREQRDRWADRGWCRLQLLDHDRHAAHRSGRRRREPAVSRHRPQSAACRPGWAPTTERRCRWWCSDDDSVVPRADQAMATAIDHVPAPVNEAALGPRIAPGRVRGRRPSPRHVL